MWLNQFTNVNIFSIDYEKKEPWENFCCNAPKLKKNQEIFEKLKNSDYFIFQDVMDKEKFISSEDLYKKSNCKNLCVTNFYFNYNEKEKSLKELKKRANKSKQKYNEFLDVTDFIEKNYDKLLLVRSKTEHNHPTKFYYKELITKFCVKFPELCLKPINLPKKTHGKIDENFIEKIKKLYPNIKYKDI